MTYLLLSRVQATFSSITQGSRYFIASFYYGNISNMLCSQMSWFSWVFVICSLKLNYPYYKEFDFEFTKFLFKLGMQTEMLKMSSIGLSRRHIWTLPTHNKHWQGLYLKKMDQNCKDQNCKFCYIFMLFAMFW